MKKLIWLLVICVVSCKGKEPIELPPNVLYKKYNDGLKMSYHQLKDEALEGYFMKWDMGIILACGIYKNGQPWEGYFLYDKMKDSVKVDTKVIPSNISNYFVYYENGEQIKEPFVGHQQDLKYYFLSKKELLEIYKILKEKHPWEWL